MRNKIKTLASSIITNKTNEEFLERKTKKRWTDGSGYKGYMLYARAITITFGNVKEWDWKCFKETRIEVIKLGAVCWLDFTGRLKISDLSPGVVYEVAYEVKLTNSAYGWEYPLISRLTLPNGRLIERQLSLLGEPRAKWFEINLGSFPTEEGEQGEVSFQISEIAGGHWKSGLIIKGAIIRPKL